jgi:hypothetical protein
VAAQTGTRPDKIRIQKWHTVFKVGKALDGGLGSGRVCSRGLEKRKNNTPAPHFGSLTKTPKRRTKQDHITLADYEIHDGMGLELYYN